MTSDSSKPAIGYIFLPYGTKAQFRRDKRKLPGFTKQQAKIRWIAKELGCTVKKWCVDHNTNRRAGPFDQGNFITALHESERQSMPLIVADFFRLAGRYGFDEGVTRISQLNKRSVLIIDATSAAPVKAMKTSALRQHLAKAIRETNAHRAVVKHGIKAAKAEADPGNRAITRRYRAPRSFSVASDHAREIENLVGQISSELPPSKRKNYAEIARELNSRGINTRSGNPWSRNQVRRTLLRAAGLRTKTKAKSLLAKTKAMSKK